MSEVGQLVVTRKTGEHSRGFLFLTRWRSLPACPLPRGLFVSLSYASPLRTGRMTTREVCYRDLRLQVNASLCDPSTRPAPGAAPCQVSACPPR